MSCEESEPLVGRFIWGIVHWIILPSILVGILVYNFSIIDRQRDPHVRTSAQAGVWAGLISFVIFVTTRLSSVQPPSLGGYPGMSLLEIFIVGAVGFLVFFIIRSILPTRFVGLLSWVLTASSSIALYSYLFLGALKESIIISVLGLALGGIVHVIIFPQTTRLLWPERKNKHHAT